MEETKKAKLHILTPRIDYPTWAPAFLLLCAFLARLFGRIGLTLSNPTLDALMWILTSYLVPLLVWAWLRRKTIVGDLWLRPVKAFQIPLLACIALALPLLNLILSLPFGNMAVLDKPFSVFGTLVPLSGGTVPEKILMIFTFLILPVLFDEIMFRCLLPHTFAQKGGPLVTALFSSLLFAFLDFDPGTFLSSFVTGLVLYLVLYVTRSLTPVLIIRLLYQAYVLFFRSEIVSFYRSSGSGTVFLFLVFFFFALLAFLICTCMIFINRRYAQTLKNNEEAYGRRTKLTVREYAAVSLKLIANCGMDPFLWACIVLAIAGLFV